MFKDLLYQNIWFLENASPYTIVLIGIWLLLIIISLDYWIMDEMEL